MTGLFEKLHAKLFGNKKAQQPKTIYSTDTTSHAQYRTTDKREPYYIQIGLDFGTSFSKCIFREVHANRAWIYRHTDTQNPFLIPSPVIISNNILSTHRESDILYPENGLVHLKFAIERAFKGDLKSHVVAPYKSASLLYAENNTQKFIDLCAIYYLASTICSIKKKARSIFEDFGTDNADQFCINMAIPVSSASDTPLCNHYKHLLKKAWVSSDIIDSTTKISIAELDSIVTSLDISWVQDETCSVYPEVSANVQAFIRSPASSPDPRTIYFFSDTGAGTVDQSVFTYTAQNDKLNYFSANVFPYGSSVIESLAHNGDNSNSSIEFWRKEKEKGSTHRALSAARKRISHELSYKTKKYTLEETIKCLHTGPGVNPISSIIERTKIIFGGGGHCFDPYEESTQYAFKLATSNSKDIQTTSIKTPQELDLPSGHDHWMRRLFVAYGLSFSTADLAENTFPSENHIDPRDRCTNTAQQCTCRGMNRHCIHCHGNGIID